MCKFRPVGHHSTSVFVWSYRVFAKSWRRSPTRRLPGRGPRPLVGLWYVMCFLLGSVVSDLFLARPCVLWEHCWHRGRRRLGHSRCPRFCAGHSCQFRHLGVASPCAPLGARRRRHASRLGARSYTWESSPYRPPYRAASRRVPWSCTVRPSVSRAIRRARAPSNPPSAT